MKKKMKKLFIGIQILFLAVTANATGQDGDIIYIDSVRWVLLDRPVCRDSLLYNHLKSVLPAERPITSANWDGFTSYWSIMNDEICLDSIRCEHYDANCRKQIGERIPADTLLSIFRKYVDGSRIVASWLTGEFRVATGKVIYYQHNGFMRNYEVETIINIDKGKVVGKKEYNNYIIDGFSFDSVKDNAKIRELFPLHIEQYPELSDVKCILFSIKKARVDAQGNLVECEVKVVRPKVNQRLAEEMEGLLKAYRPWKVSFINGEYRADGIAHWAFPYLLDN